jgi:hypothetical protein
MKIVYNTTKTNVSDKINNNVSEMHNLMRYTNTHTFLSPSTKELHNSLEKAKQKSSIVYTTTNLRAVWKNVIESIDHILNHDLVLENPNIAWYVNVIERQIQSIKDYFTKEIMSIVGERIGNDNEVTYASFNNKQKEIVENDSSVMVANMILLF